MNQHAFSKIWIIVISLVLIAGGILAYQYWWVPKEVEYPDIPVVYAQEDSIWLYTLATDTREKIIENGSAPCLSSNGEIVAYSIGTEIRLYSLETEEDKLLIFYKDLHGYMGRPGLWSPNDKYLIMDAGTTPQRSNQIISTETGKQVGYLSSVGTLYWLDKEEIVYLTPQEVDPPRVAGSGLGIGIVIFNVKTGQKKILKRATGLKDYGDEFGLLEDNSIQFSEWIIEEKSTTYWIMDREGKIVKQIHEPEHILYKASEKIKGLISDKFPEQSRLSVSPRGLSGNWYSFKLWINQHYNGLFIINTEDKDSFNKIDVKSETADWQTYYNEKYGIDFKYPKLWTLDESSALAINHPDQKRNFVQVNVTNGINVPQDESVSPCEPGYASLVYQIGHLRELRLREGQQTFEKFEEFVDFLIENPERGRTPTVKPVLIQTIVGGHNAFKIEDVYSNCKRGFYYVEQGSDHYMTISLIAEKNDDKLIIDQILSTFRFLE